MTEKEYLSRVAEYFDDVVTKGIADRIDTAHFDAARAAFARCRLERSHSFLEIGCGTGFAVRWACHVHRSVEGYGVDLSAEMIRRARALSTDVPNARFINAAFPVPELRAESFDSVFAVDSFCYLPDPLWALINVHRVLKPGGRFVCMLTDYAGQHQPRPVVSTSELNRNLLTGDQWRTLASDAGLLPFEQSYINASSEQTREGRSQYASGRLLIVARRPVLED